MTTPGALDHVRIVLVRPLQSGNVGAAARAIANHGLGGLVLVDPPAFDPDEARWMAPGTAHVVDDARIVATVDEATAGCSLVVGTTARARRWDWPVWSPAALVDALQSDTWRGRPTAILFGPEDFGLSNADMARCAAVLALPTTDRSSINLAQAVTVTCAHLLAGVRSPGPPLDAGTDVALQARAVDAVMGVLGDTGYFAGRSEEQVAGTIFRLVNRARPDRKDLGVVLGMTNKVRWALDHPDVRGEE